MADVCEVRSTLLSRSIALASALIVRTDIAYHAQLRHIERARLHGRDTAQLEMFARLLSEQLERNHTWLRFLQRLES